MPPKPKNSRPKPLKSTTTALLLRDLIQTIEGKIQAEEVKREAIDAPMKIGNEMTEGEMIDHPELMIEMTADLTIEGGVIMKGEINRQDLIDLRMKRLNGPDNE